MQKLRSYQPTNLACPGSSTFAYRVAGVCGELLFSYWRPTLFRRLCSSGFSAVSSYSTRSAPRMLCCLSLSGSTPFFLVPTEKYPTSTVARKNRKYPTCSFSVFMFHLPFLLVRKHDQTHRRGACRLRGTNVRKQSRRRLFLIVQTRHMQKSLSRT